MSFILLVTILDSIFLISLVGKSDVDSSVDDIEFEEGTDILEFSIV